MVLDRLNDSFAGIEPFNSGDVRLSEIILFFFCTQSRGGGLNSSLYPVPVLSRVIDWKAYIAFILPDSDRYIRLLLKTMKQTEEDLLL